MPHLIAWTGSVSAGATDAAVAALRGTAEYVQNDRHVLARDQFLLWLYARGANITRVRLDAPSLRAMVLPRFPLIRRSATNGSAPPVNDLAYGGFVLRAREEIAAATSNDLSAGNETHHVIALVGDSPSPQPRQPEWWLRATGATTLSPNAWTHVPLTYEQTLPAGRYRIVAMIAHSATGVAARVIIPGQVDRPGVLCLNALGEEPNRFLLGNRYGDFGSFDTVALPSVEFLSTAADTAQEVYFGITRI